MKNYSDTIGNRTRDLPTCSAVPQPTAPPRIGLSVPRKIEAVSFIVLRKTQIIPRQNKSAFGEISTECIEMLN
jgi:hypothetical protein